MDLTRKLVFFLHLLIMILQVVQQSVASEMDGDRKWRKMKVDQIHTTNDHSNNNKLMNHQVVGSNINIPSTSSGNVLRLHSMDMDSRDEKNGEERIHVEPHVHHHHHQHTRVHDGDDMDPSVLVFFNWEDLKIGKTMLVHFPNRFLSSSNFLPKQAADEIPFSSENLPTLLQSFSFPQGSPQATAMENTLRECEAKPIQGETKLCATSLASMFDFAKDIFDDNDSKIQILSTVYKTNLTAVLQKYTITEVPVEISAPKMIACHTMPYPYGILYCHYQDTESRVYRVQLVSRERGDEVEAIAVCHMDTSQWSRNHISFRLLEIEPGSQPVCHFFPADNLVLLPST